MQRPSQAQGWRIPGSWLVVAYAAIFITFARTVQLTWPLSSPVQYVNQLDGRTQRMVLTHQDTAQARFSVRHLHDGLHLEGSALRGLQLMELGPRMERDCELDFPHVHSSDIEENDLVVALAGKTARPGVNVIVSVGNPTPAGQPFSYRRLANLAMAEDWQEVRAKVDFWHPHGPHSAITPFPTILLEFKPPNSFDLAIRDLRFLAVPRAEKSAAR